MLYRSTRAAAETLTAALGLEMKVDKGELQVGIDGNQGELAARISNPNNALFYIDNLPGIEIDRYGLYVNWAQPLGDWDMSLGARVDQHQADAGIAETGPAVPDMPKMLAMKFNQSDRTWQDTTGDFVGRFWTTKNQFTWRISIARKNRVPGHLERYAWLPTPASAGLADGNNYVGDLELKPETASIVEAGFDFNGDRWWVRPTIYYHQVDDFIQGIPFDDTPDVVDHPVEMVSAMNGDPSPLRFANVDAKMFGVDADYGVQLAKRWRLEGVLSVVRGERRDINDDLYRISPDRLTLGVVYETARWMTHLEGVLVDAQDKVSATNLEETTSGYGIVNLYSQWKARDGLTVSAGLENIFDKQYQGHLNGYNRIADSDVAMGERLPGTGRSLYLRIQLKR
jgi:iron complex outermembrane receptor protein